MTEALTSKLAALPTNPGVYLMKDAAGKVLYVGKATSLRQRVRSYFQPSGPKGRSRWIEMMLERVADLGTVITNSPLEALMLEINLVRQHRPPFNTRLSDDKHYPYLMLTFSEDFPRIRVVRQVRQDGNAYFGPYADAKAMRRTLRTIRQIFGACTCNRVFRPDKPEQPCLDHHLGRCPAPCAGLISKEDYRAHVRRIASFLSGQHRDTVKALRDRMASAAADLRFETAAKIRDQLAAIERVCEKQKVIATDLADQDVIGLHVAEDRATVQVFYVRAGRLIEQQTFIMRGAEGDTEGESETELLAHFLNQYYARAAFVPKEILLPAEPAEADLVREFLARRRGNAVHLTVPQRGEKRRLVELATQNAQLARDHERQMAGLEEERAQSRLSRLRDALGMDDLPRRIECFDISTLQGGESVGSMVVFRDGRPEKSEYRRFRIRQETGRPDDYAMMREVLARRFGAHRAGDEKFAELPDLLVVDGGKGQLSTASAVLDEADLDIRVIGLAKKFEHVFVPEQSDPVVLDATDEGLNVLVRLRDEAHRFAVEYHRKLRSRRVSRSILDEVPGIGPKRKQALLSAFPSIDALRAASIDDLAAVPGMNTKIAAQLRKYLNPTKRIGGTRRERAPTPEES